MVGNERRENFARDPMNTGRKLAVVVSIQKSVEEKGVIPDCRGRMWLVDKADAESLLG